MAKDTQCGKGVVAISEDSGIDPVAAYQTYMSRFTDIFVGEDNPAAGWEKMNRHWMNFLGARFKQRTALLQRLSNCSNATEVSAACEAFSTETIQDYRLEFAEVSELAQMAYIQSVNTGLAGTNQR
jgi:hypothetical protein